MIIVNIKSGIGNQLFQYAFGRKLAILNKTKLKLSLGEYNKSTLIHKKDNVKYRLNKFCINAEIATDSELKPFIEETKFQKIKWNKYFLFKLGPLSKVYKRIYNLFIYFFNYKRKHINQNNPLLKIKNVYTLRGDFYFDGYWGEYKHLQGIREVLLKELVLRDEVKTSKYHEWSKLIKETNNSVSIHIRGLSGEASNRYNSYFGIPQLDYFEKAMFEIIELVENPSFFIFTDNWEWTKENFKTNYPIHFVKDIGREEDYLDSDFLELDLMSKCKHNIIINSTFSWWAAWLNKNPGKYVIVPAKWYNDKKAQKAYEKGSLVPAEWIKV